MLTLADLARDREKAVILKRCIEQRATWEQTLRALGYEPDPRDPRYYDAATWELIEETIDRHGGAQ
jgi:hypothetical protein